jgi:mRNA-degrading endonuclease RelE of RelBE toxin-antitoxin system
MPRVVWSAEAVADLLELAGQDQRRAERIREAVEQYARGERVDIQSLKGSKGEWRLRSGDWRILLRARQADEMEVSRVLNRRDAYE